jgi:hypothetical protein
VITCVIRQSFLPVSALNASKRELIRLQLRWTMAGEANLNQWRALGSSSCDSQFLILTNPSISKGTLSILLPTTHLARYFKILRFHHIPVGFKRCAAAGR